MPPCRLHARDSRYSAVNELSDDLVVMVVFQLQDFTFDVAVIVLERSPFARPW